MKPRFPESTLEKAMRLARGVKSRVSGTSGALESVRNLGLLPPTVLERKIATRLAASEDGTPMQIIEALANRKAAEGYEIADKLARGEINARDLTEETIANLEAVISVKDRPALFVRNDAPQTDESETEENASDYWTVYIAACRNAVRSVCSGVGCIFKLQDDTCTPIGTGWLIAERTLVTNAHVAGHLALRNAATPASDPRRGWRLRPDQAGVVDFAFENGGGRSSRLPITQVLYVEENQDPDIAIFRVEGAGNSPTSRPTIRLDLTANRPEGWADTLVFAVGHPVADMQDDANVKVVFGRLDATKRISPGKLMGILGNDVLAHDCSTTNGSSGSPLIDFASFNAVGLHYFGKPGERNEAVFLPAIAAHPAIVKSRSGDWGI